MPPGLRKRRRKQMIVLAILCLASATVVIGYGAREGIEFYRSPTQITQNPELSRDETFRLGGLVESGSLEFDGPVVRFSVTDGAHTVMVEYEGILPDLFREGQGVVALGSLGPGSFVATQILAKHDENYMPKEVMDILKAEGVYRPPE
ncbi:MAG: cytochrome c maturation protein CcmE [Paracoccaceae bacterium]|nr:cytochrome c maturation protein CcmE [Paracoccaceae bacterium]MDE2914382.1 cytochrome c maturation protein CcmE [Paracoccaceae bacterium]